MLASMRKTCCTSAINKAHPNIGVWNQEHWHSEVKIWVWDQESRILPGLYGPLAARAGFNGTQPQLDTESDLVLKGTLVRLGVQASQCQGR